MQDAGSGPDKPIDAPGTGTPGSWAPLRPSLGGKSTDFPQASQALALKPDHAVKPLILCATGAADHQSVEQTVRAVQHRCCSFPISTAQRASESLHLQERAWCAAHV